MLRFSALAAALLAVCGCASAPRHSTLQGPDHPARVEISDYSYRGPRARRALTDHYAIYTTIHDDETVATLAQVAEGALEQYHRLAPDVVLSDRPMECYLFAYRTEWAEFTQRKTGDDAAVYLQINRGGYTVGDWYVAYFIGDLQTYSVAAHEGWHQFVARHLKDRLPPFLEEGIACMFEYVQWDGRLPRWDLSVNPGRLSGLRSAVRGKHLFPLSELITMHAGQVVDQKMSRIEAFYAQNWAFARFLWEGQGGKYRGALRRMMADAAAGKLYDLGATRPTTRRPWSPRTVAPLLERYLDADLSTIESEFDEYVLSLVRGSREAASP